MAPIRRRPLALVLGLALVAPLIACGSSSNLASAPLTARDRDSVLVPVRKPAPREPLPSPPLPEDPPRPMPPERPVEPIDLPVAPDPSDECQSDVDCADGHVCSSRIVAACPTCDGGRLVRVCLRGGEPLPSLPDPVDPAGCPRHVDCMPPLRPGTACPPPGLIERCPHTQVTY